MYSLFRAPCPMCGIGTMPAFLTNISRFGSTLNMGGEELQIIRHPIGKQQAFLKAKAAKKRKGQLVSLVRPGKLLISTNERKLDLYTNEFPTKFEPPTLTSQTWTSRKSPGRYFIIHRTRENPSTFHIQNQDVKFDQLGLSQEINNALANLGMHHPTNIQNKVIPHVLKGENVMLAAETGSGKTYGYLLPILQSFLQIPKNDRKRGPFSIILTPSKELSSQVLKMSNDLELPIKICSVDENWTKKKKVVIRKADIIIGTPILMLSALRGRLFSLNDIKFAVVDECDTLLDESFSWYICGILARMNIQNGLSQPLVEDSSTQLILSSATFPSHAEEALRDLVPVSDLSSVSTGYMHRISPHVTHKFLRVRPSEKFSSLIHVLQENDKKKTRLTMVFCNRKETVHWVARELPKHGFNIDKIHNEIDFEDRQEALEKAIHGKTRVLICTDLSSRGLDTRKVTHVINYDFPNAASDYIHRSGRVGRVGQDDGGEVTSLISKKWEIPLVMKIEEAARRRERIVGVNANIKSYHNKRWDEKFQGLEEYMEGDVLE